MAVISHRALQILDKFCM